MGLIACKVLRVLQLVALTAFQHLTSERTTLLLRLSNSEHVQN